MKERKKTERRKYRKKWINERKKVGGKEGINKRKKKRE